MLRADNSIQSPNTPSLDSLYQRDVNRADGLQRGMIFKVYYTDDPSNPTKNSQNPSVVYDVILISGPSQGQIIPFCRTASALGGQHNYEEIVLRKASKPFSGPGRVPFNQQDGDVVLVEFIGNNLSSPLITSCSSHPLDVANTGATTAHGPRYVREYNGVQHLIDKNGNFTITRKGGSYDSVGDFFKPASGVSSSFKLEDNKITIVTKDGTTVTIDGAKDEVSIKAAGGGALKIAKGKVGLGGASAEVVDLISQIADALTQSQGNLGLPLSNVAAFAAIKAKADGIKGGI